MVNKCFSVVLAFVLLSLSEPALGRIRWSERDGKAIFLHPRRFGQEHPAVLDKLSAACPGQVCGNLAGQAVTPLLAAQGECTQQDMADAIINASRQFDNATQSNMIAIAVEYRQAEKNTPPDFSTNPPTNRNSVFCQKSPQNSELDGLVQAQDPANDPNAFFDPAEGKTVQKGSQPNTFPFGTSGSSSSTNSTSSNVGNDSSASVTAVTVSVTSTAAPTVAPVLLASDSTPCPTAVTVTVSGNAAAATSTAAAGSIGNFGKCSIPQIEFGTGFDGRKETSFQPVDKTSFNHGSAQNIDIITQFICDTLTNSCGADQTAKNTCKSAQAAADTVTAKTGGQADAFNAVFGITTDFAAVAEVDDQGNVVAGTGSTASSGSSSSGASGTESAAAAATASSTASSSSIGNFGSCSVPQIEFGTGFDGRKETSFQPVDKTSFNHGSAQNIDIITQFICDTLTNSCGADQTAKNTCATAQADADKVTKGTGGQADAFNAAFGIKTDFAAVAEVDDQGNVVANTGSSGAGSASASNATNASPSTSAASASNTPSATSDAASGDSSIGNFGSCTVPQIEFGTGFDGRKETSFEPVDKKSFNHGSAQNIDIITQFICDTLTNTCGADQTAKNTCATAQAAADKVTKGTGGQADAFNAAFGIKTDFAAVAEVDDQGNVVSGTGSSDSSAASQAPAPASSGSAAAATNESSSASTGGNLQTFTGNLGGVTAPPVTANGDGTFQVQGNSKFNNLQSALQRSCDVQNNQCADAANSSGNKGSLTVAACNQQQQQCNSGNA